MNATKTYRQSKEKGSFVIPIGRARAAALELVGLLRPACHRIEVAGSVRRGSPTVHDIDLVAWAIYEVSMQASMLGEQVVIPSGPGRLVESVRALGSALSTPIPDASILRFEYHGLPVEIYLATRSGTNFGALLQMRTGSREFNIQLAIRARQLGLYYMAGYGIFTHATHIATSRRVDDGSEEGIFHALGLEYMLPSERSGAAPMPLRKVTE